MPSIVPPPDYPQLHDTHPDIPEQGDDEDIVDYIGRVADVLTETPPAAPPGFRLIQCTAEPRHFPLYDVAEAVFYDTPCLGCMADDSYRENRRLTCRLNHRRWKSWRVWQRLSSWTYVMGITASGGGTSYGRCEFCGVGRQHSQPRFKGKRSYFLGVLREDWYCLLKRRHRRRVHYPSGLCVICCPCPDCGSTGQDHYTCEVVG